VISILGAGERLSSMSSKHLELNRHPKAISYRNDRE
jgi:hypothetical protein